MELTFTPEMQAQLDKLASGAGRPAEDLVREVVSGYVHEVTGLRETLDRRYDDLESGRVEAIDGEAFFANLRARAEELRKRSSE